MDEFDKSAESKFILTRHYRNGDVQYISLEDPSGLQEGIMWRVEGGTSFDPERHQYPHLLTIVEGNGVISVAGIDYPYSPGWSFWIDGEVMHGLIRVDTTTVILQTRPYIYLYRP